MTSTLRRVRWAAVRDGAGLSLAIALPVLVAAGLTSEALDLRHRSNWVFLFSGALMAGMASGGWLAARRGPQRSLLLHAGLAALGADLVLGGGTTLLRLLASKEADPVALAFSALVATAAGIMGGLVAATSRPLRRRSQPGHDRMTG